MFNMTEKFLEEKKGIYTAREIYQQPGVWKKIYENYKENRERFQRFIERILANHQRVRVIFTGAGTSAFIGDILTPVLQREQQRNFDYVAIPTTDLVAQPDSYFLKNVPTILVSFGRSGNSPESVAAMELASKNVINLYQVVITCNKKGKMVEAIANDPNGFLFLLPDETHDKGFAMTSSFSGMALASYLLFTEKKSEVEKVGHLSDEGAILLEKLCPVIDEILTFEFDRIVYLGSASLGQLSHEAALKMLELTAGKVVAVHESSMGFRHGPKSILRDKTLVVLFVSQNEYTKKYDFDILREIKGDSPEVKTVVLSSGENEEFAKISDWFIKTGSTKGDFDQDLYYGLLYVLFAQVLALKKSLQLGITPDNPSPDGRVNRVVQGVVIYPWDK